MTPHEFNCKVNLPKVMSFYGKDGYSFVKMPVFGWHAFDKSKSQVLNLFDLFYSQDLNYAYNFCTKYHPEFLPEEMTYHEVADGAIKNKLQQIYLWEGLYVESKKEITRNSAYIHGKLVNPKKVLQEQGYPAFFENTKAGFLTKDVLAKFPQIQFTGPDSELKNRILVPTFYTPSHLASLEVLSLDLKTRKTIWVNQEKGWYGDITVPNVVSGIRELSITPGFTYNYKIDYWTDKPLKIDGLTPTQYVDIWAATRNAVFRKSPLSYLKQEHVAMLADHVDNLNYTQICEIEKETGLQLADLWKQSQHKKIHVGKNEFRKKDNCYYIDRNGQLELFSNFTMEIESISFSEEYGKFFRKGLIYHDNSVIPFVLPEDVFDYSPRLLKAIKVLFISNNIGLPVVNPNFIQFLRAVIDTFNQNYNLVKKT